MAEDAWDAKAITVSRGRGFGPWYSIMRWIGKRTSGHFFSSIEVVGQSHIPTTGPFILVCTHFSTIMDVAIISSYLPHNRPIHYWAKKGLYRGKTIAWILNDSGNIQVDRKNKDNQELFKGTFDAMQAGEAIGLFPEGGSFTEPRLHSIKAGAAWAALEYAKFLAGEDGKAVDTNVLIVPASLNYTEKSRFRSKAVFNIGKPFSVDEYTDEFLAASTNDPASLLSVRSENSSFPYSAPMTPAATSGEEDSYLSTASIGSNVSKRGATRRTDQGAKSAVQKLTDRIGRELNEQTVNAPDWRTWHAMKMARELLWQGDIKRNCPDFDMKEFVPIGNAILALFIEDAQPMPHPQAVVTIDLLVRLQALQLASRTDLPTLNAIAPPLAAHNYSFPSFGRTTRGLLYNLLALALKTPLYAPVLAFYAPAYFAGYYVSSRHAKHEEESMASVKSLVAFPVAFLMHAILFLLVSAVFLFTPPGLVVAAVVNILLRLTAERLVLTDGYNQWKLVGAFGRCLLIHLGVVKSMKGHEEEIRVMVKAVQEAQPVQWTLTKAFKTGRGGSHHGNGSSSSRRRSSSRGRKSIEQFVLQDEGAEADDERGGPKAGNRSTLDGFSQLKNLQRRTPLRRPAPIRLLKLTLETRREALVALKEYSRTILRDEGAIRQKEAWRYIESKGGRLS